MSHEFIPANDDTGPRRPVAGLAENDSASMASQAERCRRLAAGICDRQAADVLNEMAERYERSSLASERN